MVEATDRLSPRELQVLRGLAAGKSNAEIGEDLYVSVSTVRACARRLYERLEARNRPHAVALGYERGLLTPAYRGGEGVSGG